MKRFAESFASCGFQASSFYPSYGLAEATLLVSGGSLSEKKLRTVEVSALEQNHVVELSEQKHNVRTLVGCGRAMLDTKIVIVNPETLSACPSDEVGEIWVSGPSVTAGYWNKPEESERICRAFLSDTWRRPVSSHRRFGIPSRWRVVCHRPLEGSDYHRWPQPLSARN